MIWDQIVCNNDREQIQVQGYSRQKNNNNNGID